MAAAPDRFPVLYSTVLLAARETGIDAAQLPDFLDIEGVTDFDLLGQDELRGTTFETVVEITAAKKRTLLPTADAAQTVRLAEQALRLGQHRFAAQVLNQYAHTCTFCGFSPKSIPRHRLLVASHIKPWAASNDAERLDPHNGIAACPTHDAAFDTGLITINGGLRVHRAPNLKRSTTSDAEVDRYFGDALAETLIIPDGVEGPRASYLKWHHDHIYQGQLAS